MRWKSRPTNKKRGVDQSRRARSGSMLRPNPTTCMCSGVDAVVGDQGRAGPLARDSRPRRGGRCRPPARSTPQPARAAGAPRPGPRPASVPPGASVMSSSTGELHAARRPVQLGGHRDDAGERLQSAQAGAHRDRDPRPPSRCGGRRRAGRSGPGRRRAAGAAAPPGARSARARRRLPSPRDRGPGPPGSRTRRRARARRKAARSAESGSRHAGAPGFTSSERFGS